MHQLSPLKIYCQTDSRLQRTPALCIVASVDFEPDGLKTQDRHWRVRPADIDLPNSSGRVKPPGTVTTIARPALDRRSDHQWAEYYFGGVYRSMPVGQWLDIRCVRVTKSYPGTAQSAA